MDTIIFILGEYGQDLSKWATQHPDGAAAVMAWIKLLGFCSLMLFIYAADKIEI